MRQALDLTFINQLMGHDEKMVDKFLAIFKSQCPQQMRELKLHYSNNDMPSVSNVAHSLKTQFSYLSLKSLSDDALAIETLAENGMPDQLGQLIAAFERDLNELLEHLE